MMWLKHPATWLAVAGLFVACGTMIGVGISDGDLSAVPIVMLFAMIMLIPSIILGHFVWNRYMSDDDER